MDNHETDPIFLTAEEIKAAIAEANRCLNCRNPKCQEGCPISNDIQEFIVALAGGNIGEARQIIARKSNLPAICGRVCAHEKQCEGHCVLYKAGNGIKIGMLERCIADFAFQMELPQPKVPQKTRGKVAVIGSGPAGLTVAGDLAKLGFDVTVYEALSEPGGILLYGIPSYRLSKKVVRREIKGITALGVQFVTDCMVGRDITVDQMFENGFDAVFIGTGTAIAKELDVPGKGLEGIVQSTYLLRMHYLYRSGQLPRGEVLVRPGDRVYVIGAGNVGFDTARSAMRLEAASVTVLHQGTPETIPALKTEQDRALGEGVQILCGARTVGFVGEEGKLTAITVQTPEGERTLPADKAFLAIGSRPANRIVSTTTGIDVDAEGYVVTRERPYGMTTKNGVFAGGDVVHHPANVVTAMRQAKKVAAGIVEYVDAVHLLRLCDIPARQS